MRVSCQKGQKLVIKDGQGRTVEIIIFKVGSRYVRLGVKAPMDIRIERIDVRDLPKDRPSH